MQTPMSECSVCHKQFAVQFRYQVQEVGGKFTHFCSQTCQQQAAGVAESQNCDVCQQHFQVEHAFQVQMDNRGRHYFCSTACAAIGASQTPTIDTRSSQRIAIFNHKGGTAKTTTAINLAAGLAERGMRVLLVDADGQGNVGAALGINGERSLYHCLVAGANIEDIAIPVRQNLDVITSNETLAAAELYLAGQANRHRVMRDRLAAGSDNYDMVILDCAPALSLMNQNALMYANSVVVPVSCDYLALVGVKQVLRTIKNMREAFHHDLQLLGVLPTFFDVRNRICRDAVDALSKHFQDRYLPPVRVNTKLREAPSVKQTIFEYAPESSGATDYLCLVQHIMDLNKPKEALAITAATQHMPQATLTGFIVPTM